MQGQVRAGQADFSAAPRVVNQKYRFKDPYG
jgi:hypothetical protein